MLCGVGKDLPTIPGYREDIITVSAGASFYEVLRLMNKLTMEPKEQLSYELKTKLDVGVLYPAIRVTQQGDFSVSDYSSGGFRADQTVPPGTWGVCERQPGKSLLPWILWSLHRGQRYSRCV